METEEWRLKNGDLVPEQKPFVCHFVAVHGRTQGCFLMCKLLQVL